MTRSHISRRQILGTICGTGAVGLAGCGSFLQSGSPYVCTAIDDESTGRYDEEDNPIPYTFEIPEVMSVENVNRSENGGRVAFAQEWEDRRGSEVYSHTLDLEVGYRSFQAAVKPMMFGSRRGSIVGKRTADGYGVGLIQRDASESGVRLEVTIPSMTNGNRVFRTLDVEVSAILQGDQRIEADARSDDSDQTCEEAMRTLAVDVVDSVPAVSPAEGQTTLGITPSSATVRRDESVDLTVETSGVGWIDLVIEGDGEFVYQGSLAVESDPVTLTVAPPTSGSTIDAVSVAESGQLDAYNAGGAFTPGAYSVEMLAPGTDEPVRASTSLTVEPAG